MRIKNKGNFTMYEFDVIEDESEHDDSSDVGSETELSDGCIFSRLFDFLYFISSYILFPFFLLCRMYGKRGKVNTSYKRKRK